MVTRTTAEDTADFVAPEELRFDLSNPRFADEERFETEEDIVRYLTQHVDVDELLQSIRSAGYVDFEPLIVQRKGRIVLEGNRRLAALRLLGDESLRKRLRVPLPEVDDPKAPPDRVRVKWVDDRTDARAFIGFKHINGPFKWDAFAKARFAAEWFESGGNIATISRTLGDSHNTVRRLVNGWYALKQASEDGFDREDRSKPRFAFSHLYTALTRASVREFLGLTPEDLSAPPRPDPVPPENRKELQTLMSWLYGQERRGEPALIQSQNPNLNQLSDVLGNAEAQQMLLANRNLQAAFERVEPPSSRFSDALMKAAKQCEDAMAVSGAYDGDPTLFRVATNMNETTDSLVVVMQAKTREKGK
ncbi:MAG: hypothetical protein OXG35_01280 [Acidobacteria bacterium]|nr:hypothetical protein [Acidobacteriota bacterium]